MTTPRATPLTLIRGVNRKSHPAMLPIGFPVPPSQPHHFSWAVGGQLWSSHVKVDSGNAASTGKLWVLLCAVGFALWILHFDQINALVALQGFSVMAPATAHLKWAGREPCQAGSAQWCTLIPPAACPEQLLAEMCPSSLLESRKGDEPQGKRNKNLNRTRIGSAYEFCIWSTAWLSLWNHHFVSLIIQRNAASDIRRLN